MRDEIIQELWRIKDELAREANYDVHVLCQELRHRQISSHVRIVGRSGRVTDSEAVAGSTDESTSLRS
jgi:hypothetical protein